MVVATWKWLSRLSRNGKRQLGGSHGNGDSLLALSRSGLLVICMAGFCGPPRPCCPPRTGRTGAMAVNLSERGVPLASATAGRAPAAAAAASALQPLSSAYADEATTLEDSLLQLKPETILKVGAPALASRSPTGERCPSSNLMLSDPSTRRGGPQGAAPGPQ